MDQQAEKIKPKNSGTKKVFDNPILERLTRTHISVPITILMTIAAVLLYIAFVYTDYTQLTPLYVIGLFILGFFSFTLIEYIAHRYLFHMRPTTELKRKVQYALHGLHHEYPKDKDRLAMPPIMSLLLATILFFVFYFLIDTKVFGFLPGFITGYCGYLFVHFIVHAYAPPNNIFKGLWLNHSIHHYKDNTQIFGVSSQLWDYVFGTIKK
ncbi:sterol desaturase family protein [uncultured Cytophaga sp.]|uniref:sterol desaturase family protein n=1 Tax=uncultured Cytophaga sp. TaxID=160238 RepID=UPI002620B673|nr:sterol desaturase family protein [uncultured Cytophaga sp.]